MKNFNKTTGQTSTPLLADFLTSRPTKGDNASNSLKIFRQNAVQRDTTLWLITKWDQ